MHQPKMSMLVSLRGLLAILLLLLTAGVFAADAFLSTPQGVLYKDLKPGKGEAVVVGDVVTVHFVGWLDNRGAEGREFYNTRKAGHSVSFQVGTDKVMPAWNEGVLGMRAGGKRLLRVPPNMGYGNKGVDDVVPPDARLIFMMELIQVR